jgi:hypothetical protein
MLGVEKTVIEGVVYGEEADTVVASVRPAAIRTTVQVHRG